MKRNKIIALLFILVFIISGCSSKNNIPAVTEEDNTQKVEQVTEIDSSNIESESGNITTVYEVNSADENIVKQSDFINPTQESSPESPTDSSKHTDTSEKNPNTANYGTTKTSNNIGKIDVTTNATTKPTTQNQQPTTKETTSPSSASQSRYTVIFEDFDGTVLKKETVELNASATPPDEPFHIGYRFTGWSGVYRIVRENTVIKATFEKITEPTLQVDRINAKAGEKVCVKVHVLNNPGLLGMLMNIKYDDNKLTLKEVKNGNAFTAYSFTAPKNMKSGCNAAWSIVDVPNKIEDGDIVELTFTVDKKVSQGTYTVEVSCLKNAFGANYEVIPFEVIPGEIRVK